MSAKTFLIGILWLVVSACEKEEPAMKEPTIEIESAITSIAEASTYEGEAGDRIEFTVIASAPAGLQSFYIEKEQRSGSGFSNDQFVVLDASSPEVSNNRVEYTFSRELTADDFSQTDNFIRAVIVDTKDRKAVKGFRLVRK